MGWILDLILRLFKSEKPQVLSARDAEVFVSATFPEIKLEEPYNMITMEEILKRQTTLGELPEEFQRNLEDLHLKINKVRRAYGKPMIVSSGLRTMADHLRIYREKGITDKSKIPMQSRHLLGLAADIYDPKQELQKWIKENIKLMEEIGFWFEDFSATPNWVHFQTVPPRSGRRFFYP